MVDVHPGRKLRFYPRQVGCYMMHDASLLLVYRPSLGMPNLRLPVSRVSPSPLSPVRGPAANWCFGLHTRSQHTPFDFFYAHQRQQHQQPQLQQQQPAKYSGVSQKIVGLGASGGGVTATGRSGTTGGARQDSGDDGSLEDPDELWGKDKEQKEEHHEGQVCWNGDKRGRCFFLLFGWGVVLTNVLTG